jgi:D-sedoheptulose 7-phosphate isomerase
MPSSTPTPVSSDVDATRILADRRDRLDRALAAFDERRTDAVAVIEAVGRAIAGGGKVVTCGNGGSAAEALHLAEELVGRYRSNRPAIPAICLNADPTALTCIANDFGFDEVFARQCEALLDARDVLVVFTTSGRSANLLRALDVARTRGATTVGFLGGDGGPALDRCDASVVIPGPDSAAIQEVHQVLMHAVCEQFESAAPLQPMP